MANLQIPIPDSFNDELKTMLRAAALEVIQETVKQESMAKDWMSVKEVQKYMNVSPNTVSSWISSGLKVSMVGQKRFISKHNLNAFLVKYEK